MGIIDHAKELANLVKKVGDLELYRRIVELQGEIVDVQGRVVELVQQNREKDEAIEKLKRAMELKGKMICEHSAYYEVDEQGNKVAGPFCTNCFDNEYATRRLVKGFRPKDQMGHGSNWVQCPKCKVPFESYPTGLYLERH
jgi:hypothetical protein